LKKLIFFFGAGISIPSGMPSGDALTQHWLRHHLSPEEFKEIDEQIFERHASLLEKRCPRLEKVIDDAITVFGPECLKNLLFFRDCQPNPTHFAIAEYVRRQRTYAFTTNFDTALELCDSSIPKWTNPDMPDPGWGLVKLHGCIGDDVRSLGHSIRNIQRGVPIQFQNVLRRLLDDPCSEFVFVGYSGSDYFDVTPFLYSLCQRENDHKPASVVWVFHSPNSTRNFPISAQQADDITTDGQLSLMRPFGLDKRVFYQGNTSEIVSALLKKSSMPTRLPSFVWHQGWNDRFSPNNDLKKEYAAQLFASFGDGHRAGQVLEAIRHAGQWSPRRERMWLNSIRDRGLYRAENHWRNRTTLWRQGIAPTEIERQLAASDRLSGRTLHAFYRYLRILRGYRQGHYKAEDETNALHSVLEAGIFAEAILSRFALRRWKLYAFWPASLFLYHMIVWSLNHYCRQPKTSPAKNDPHLKEHSARLMDFMTLGLWSGWWLLEGICYANRLPIEPALTPAGDDYYEIDSILGQVNADRVEAIRSIVWLRSLSYKERCDELPDWSFQIRKKLKRSLALARIINDLPGKSKAIDLFVELQKLNGKPRRKRQRLLAQVQNLRGTLRQMDSELIHLMQASVHHKD
jgi:hypothetical protein